MIQRLRAAAVLLVICSQIALPIGAQQNPNPAPGQTQPGPSTAPPAATSAPIPSASAQPAGQAHQLKLALSLEDAISLALENNLDIAVQRFTPLLDEATLLRARSGVNGRLAFDPVITGQGYIAKLSSPINNPFLAGVNLSTAGLPISPNLISHNAVGN